MATLRQSTALLVSIGGLLAHLSAAKLTSGVARIDVLSPPEMEAVYAGVFSDFSAPLPEAFVSAGAPIQVIVPQATNEEGCYPYSMYDPDGHATVVVVRRGRCSFLEKAIEAKKAAASGVIIVNTDDVAIQMDSNKSHKALGIFVLSMKSSDGEKLIAWASQHREDSAIYLKMDYYLGSKADISEALIVMMATTLVIAGAYFATADLRIGSPLAAPSEEVLEVNSEIAIGWCAVGSIMLVVLFFLMKYMIYFIIFAFCLGGATCITSFLSSCLQHYKQSLRQDALNVNGVGPVSKADLIAMVPAVSIVASWLAYRNTPYGWLPQDIIGAGFLCMIQRTLRVPNIKVATVLLSAMFFFDIFWVFLSPFIFRTSVMVEVARGGGTNQAVPMLLRLPAIGDPLGSDRMLGFGDVALPGLLNSYLLRHDMLTEPRRGCLSGYFFPSIIGYFCGLVITIGFLVFMQMGQPALLYLVPGTLGTTLLLGWKRGELTSLWEGVPIRRGAEDNCEAGSVQVGNLAEGSGY